MDPKIFAPSQDPVVVSFEPPREPAARALPAPSDHDDRQDRLERGELATPAPNADASAAAPHPIRARAMAGISVAGKAGSRVGTALTAVPKIEQYLAGNPISVGVLTGGTIATVATYLATGRQDDTLSWGNTALATAQNIELPIGAYSVEQQIRDLRIEALEAHWIEHRHDRVPDLLPQDLNSAHLGFFDRSLRVGNNFLRPFARWSGQIAGSAPVMIGAQLGLGALWLGYGLSNPCCDVLIPAVNAIPQYFTTPWVSLVLNRAKEINDRVKSLEAQLHANHARLVAMGQAAPLAARHAVVSQPNVIDRIAGQARNLCGAPINYTANLIVSGGMAVKAGIQGLDSEFNGDANATLATLQFPDFMVLKNVTSESKNLAARLVNEFAPQPAQTGLWAGANKATSAFSDLFGTSYAFVASMAMLGALGLSSIGLSNDTWLTVFNGIPQCITTPVFDMAIYDINRTEASLKPLLAVLARQQEAIDQAA